MKKLANWIIGLLADYRAKRGLGFTILELLIVMAVLALVTTAGVFVAKTQIQKAHDARRKEDLAQLQRVWEHYYSDFGVYPAAEVLADCGGISLAPYLEKIPCDPTTRSAYTYVLGLSQRSYKIYTRLEWTKDPVIIQVGCVNGCGPGNAYNYGVGSGEERVGSGSTGEGVQPECGGPGKWFCFPNICSECCPGNIYRCDGSGTRCILDSTCGN